MYGLFSRKKKQIVLSSLSGGSGPPNGGQDEVGRGEPSGEPPPTSSRPLFGGHDLHVFCEVHGGCGGHGGRTLEVVEVVLYL